MYRLTSISIILFGITGCSSLGISLSPPQSILTDQAESIVNRSPRHADLPRELDMNVLVSHFLQPGDVLLVEPVELDSEIRFPADQKILADGTIDLSKFGRVTVAGLTLEQTETHIETTIANAGEKATQINVRLLEPVHRIYVLGEVASPGSYPFSGNETVLDGILAAGGLTTQANPCKVILARPTVPTSCRVALPICYREITQLGDTTTNYQLQPSDRIFVASRSFVDDLQFWKANKTCDRCCKCQNPCPDPTVAAFTNPISTILPAAPVQPKILPASDDKEKTSTLDTGSEPAGENNLPSPSFKRLLNEPPLPTKQPAQNIEGQLQFDPNAFSDPT